MSVPFAALVVALALVVASVAALDEFHGVAVGVATEESGMVTTGSSWKPDLHASTLMDALALRFALTGVPQGARIARASLELAVQNRSFVTDVGSGACTLRVRGELSAAPAPLASGGFTSRTPTTASRLWSVPTFTATDSLSVALPSARVDSLGPIVQEIVSQAAWPDSGIVMLTMTVSGATCLPGTGERTFVAHSSTLEQLAPRLIVRFECPTADCRLSATPPASRITSYISTVTLGSFTVSAIQSRWTTFVTTVGEPLARGGVAWNYLTAGAWGSAGQCVVPTAANSRLVPGTTNVTAVAPGLFPNVNGTAVPLGNERWVAADGLTFTSVSTQTALWFSALPLGRGATVSSVTLAAIGASASGVLPATITIDVEETSAAVPPSAADSYCVVSRLFTSGSTWTLASIKAGAAVTSPALDSMLSSALLARADWRSGSPFLFRVRSSAGAAFIRSPHLADASIVLAGLKAAVGGTLRATLNAVGGEFSMSVTAGLTFTLGTATGWKTESAFTALPASMQSALSSIRFSANAPADAQLCYTISDSVLSEAVGLASRFAFATGSTLVDSAQSTGGGVASGLVTFAVDPSCPATIAPASATAASFGSVDAQIRLAAASAAALIPGPTGDLSVLAWVKLDSATGTHQVLAVTGYCNSTAASVSGWELAVLNGALVLRARDTAALAVSFTTASGLVAPGVWTHVAAVVDRSGFGEVTLYVNAVAVATASLSASFGSIGASAAGAALGNAVCALDFPSASALTGALADVRVYRDWPLGARAVRAHALSQSGDLLAGCVNITARPAPPPPPPSPPPPPNFAPAPAPDAISYNGRAHVAVVASADDMTEAIATGTIVSTNASLRLDPAHLVGFRFALPWRAGVRFSSAVLRLSPVTPSDALTTVLIHAALSANAPGVTAFDRLSARTLTNASAVWNVPHFTSAHTFVRRSSQGSSADLAALLNEIVSLPAWAAGNSVLLILRVTSATGDRLVRAVDSGAAFRTPYLELELHSGGNAPVWAPAPAFSMLIPSSLVFTSLTLTFTDVDETATVVAELTSDGDDAIEMVSAGGTYIGDVIIATGSEHPLGTHNGGSVYSALRFPSVPAPRGALVNSATVVAVAASAISPIAWSGWSVCASANAASAAVFSGVDVELTTGRTWSCATAAMSGPPPAYSNNSFGIPVTDALTTRFVSPTSWPLHGLDPLVLRTWNTGSGPAWSAAFGTSTAPMFVLEAATTLSRIGPTVSLNVSFGTLSVAAAAAARVTFTAGSPLGASNLTFSGTPANVRAALGSTSYSAVLLGTYTMCMSVSDNWVSHAVLEIGRYDFSVVGVPARNVLPNGADGSLVGSSIPGVVAGPFPELEFEAADQALVVAAADEWAPALEGFSVALFARVTALPTTNDLALVTKGGSASGTTPGFALFVLTSGLVRVRVCDSLANCASATSLVTVTAGTTVHIVAVVDRQFGELQLYINGLASGSAVALSSAVGSITSAEATRVGNCAGLACGVSAPMQQLFVSDVRLYARSIEPAFVSLLAARAPGYVATRCVPIVVNAPPPPPPPRPPPPPSPPPPPPRPPPPSPPPPSPPPPSPPPPSPPPPPPPPSPPPPSPPPPNPPPPSPPPPSPPPPQPPSPPPSPPPPPRPPPPPSPPPLPPPPSPPPSPPPPIVCPVGVVADCTGLCGGTASVDGCGDCTGGTTGRLANAARDSCNVCYGGNADRDVCGECFGRNRAQDGCGVCFGRNATCAGCDGVPYSGTVSDVCGVCGGNGLSCIGCDGIAIPAGGKTFDACGVCGGTAVVCPFGCDGSANQSKVYDCAGVCDGGARLDSCSVCTGGTTGRTSLMHFTPCTVCFGSCGACGATPQDACGVCAGDGSTCIGCNGLTMATGGLTTDRCGVCGGSGLSCAFGCDGVSMSGTHYDCFGVCGGNATTDYCGVCAYAGAPTRNMHIDRCGTCFGANRERDLCLVCRGNNRDLDDCGACFASGVNGSRDACGDCFGGNRRLDVCGVCDGDGTSCRGCDGVPNSGARYDDCGVCRGNCLRATAASGLWTPASIAAAGLFVLICCLLVIIVAALVIWRLRHRRPVTPLQSKSANADELVTSVSGLTSTVLAAEVDAPSGAVFMVFSHGPDTTTELWDAYPEHMTALLGSYESVVTRAARALRGFVVKMDNDKAMIAFAASTDAFAFLSTVRATLAAVDWSEPVLAAGLAWPGKALELVFSWGLHFGEVQRSLDARTRRYDYYGTMVNRAARVAAFATNGRVVVTDAALVELGRAAPRVRESLSVISLGKQTFKGIDEPVAVFEVNPPAAAAGVGPRGSGARSAFVRSSSRANALGPSTDPARRGMLPQASSTSALSARAGFSDETLSVGGDARVHGRPRSQSSSGTGSASNPARAHSRSPRAPVVTSMDGHTITLATSAQSGSSAWESVVHRPVGMSSRASRAQSRSLAAPATGKAHAAPATIRVATASGSHSRSRLARQKSSPLNLGSGFESTPEPSLGALTSASALSLAAPIRSASRLDDEPSDPATATSSMTMLSNGTPRRA